MLPLLSFRVSAVPSVTPVGYRYSRYVRHARYSCGCLCGEFDGYARYVRYARYARYARYIGR